MTAEQVAASLAATVNELQRWFTRTTPRLVDDVFYPKTERQEVGADFVIEPICFNIELFALSDVVSSATNAIADGNEHGQILLIENISDFIITILDDATTRLSSASFAMNPHSTLLVKWNGEEWIEAARSQN